MKQRWASCWFRVTLAVTILAVFSAPLLVCWWFNVWSLRDWEIYQLMSQECHPVWRELHFGRIQAGDDLEEIIARTKPVRVERFEDVVWLHYDHGGFTGIMITARKGRLIEAMAGSCGWQRSFFDEWALPERWAFEQRYSRHLEARWKRWEAKEVEELNP